jgi:endonuclease YncB( thermonuclease family)
MMAACLLAATCTVAAERATPTVTITGTAVVLDGDTLDVDGRRVRLHGVDAPEKGQTCKSAAGAAWNCGEAAKAALARMVDGRRLVCQQRDIDRYRRIVAVCFRGKDDINAALVVAGWALAYRQYGLDYVPQEGTAQAARLGLWSGSFENPWDYRRNQDDSNRNDRGSSTPATRSADCSIKGNINADGDRIYHAPGGEFYDRTEIDAGKGERWFCSETQARSAGWRRSRR